MGKIILGNIVNGGTASDILIENGKISRISAADTQSDAYARHDDSTEVVDCTGKVAVPGFVNMHTHAGMSMMRGVGEDIAFHEWLDRIWKIEADITPEYVYHATRMACLEMIKTGTTTFNDHYWYSPMAQKAAAELGLRSVHAYVICDKNDPEEAERQKIQCQEMYDISGNWPSNASFAIAIHAIYSVSEPMILWATDFARSHGLKIHIHVSETRKEVADCKAEHGGLSPVEYLDRLGVLGPDVIAAHTLWVSEKDIEILGKRGVNCVHNVNSNLKLASGYRFLYNELRDAGANICLGTDGCASSNNLDMLETIKTSAMIQKAWRDDPTAMPLDELMQMSSANAGKALGLNIGKIEEGALADILIIDTDNYSFMSPGTFEANLIYSAHSDCIESVICDGRFIMRDRVVPLEKEILREAEKYIR
ncbi:MAG: amidohydrolase [Bacteroidales bacterium]|nr:amidohydrolase [Bacteroidales bacterium]MBQ9722157.1 amidohydrolase [Bacteroidales bacterium]